VHFLRDLLWVTDLASTMEPAHMHDPCTFAIGVAPPRARNPRCARLPAAKRMAFFLPPAGVMLRLLIVATALLGSLFALEGRAHACAALRAQARIDQFSCGSCSSSGEGNLETVITVVTGTALIFNAHASPTLTSLAVELQARSTEGTPYHSTYHSIARLVISATGTDYPPARIVQTCNGPLMSGSVAGRIAFVDANEQPLTFDQVKTIPLGTTALNFIATFAGPLPDLVPGARARVNITSTAIDTDGSHPCSIDADGDGTVDSKVKTLIFQKTVRVPTTAFLINP
jgi:hypothetical protein